MSGPGSTSSMSWFTHRLASNHHGEVMGVPSFCTSNRLALEGVCHAAAKLGVPGVLVEATCNQVNQDGGYTGMRPGDFRAYVADIAQAAGLDDDKLTFGGDHLGPNVWRKLPAEEAMAKACSLVEAYAKAGFTKIHLDCSMACADDSQPLPPEVVAARAARLAAIVEKSVDAAGRAQIRYIIGTEVPVPGGTTEMETDSVVPSTPASVTATIDAHRQAFARQGLSDAFSRIVGVVAQPGVEFGVASVTDYAPAASDGLAAWIETTDKLVFEAHSTDYQTRSSLEGLVKHHFAILKVGPELTYALREALFALADIERCLIPADRRSNLVRAADEAMLAAPESWVDYYHGDSREQAYLRRFSLSDRIRYYWNRPEVVSAVEQLLENLSQTDIPMSLVSRYFPNLYWQVRDRVVECTARALVDAHVGRVAARYFDACGDHAGA